MSETTYPRNRTDKPQKNVATACYRCGGSGIFSQFHGTCFRCGGNGVDPSYRDWSFPQEWTTQQIDEWNEAREAKNLQARVRKAERKVAKKQAAKAAYIASLDPEDAARLAEIEEIPYDERSVFVNDVLNKLTHWGSISDNQLRAIIESVEKDRAYLIAKKEKEANTPELVEGRRELTGLVISTKAKDSQYGTQYKMLVELEDGNRVWGTIPRSIDDDVWDTRETVTVKFTAAVTVSEDDEHFGFFSRPTKAEVLSVKEEVNA